jgi:hypothetical protein
MAHSQSKPAHDSRIHQENPPAHQPAEKPSQEFMIMGFPWQLVAVVGTIAGGVILLVLKAIGIF